jgi:dGTPase
MITVGNMDFGGWDWRGDQETRRGHVDVPIRSAGDVRSAFERDRARIIHSVAFRKLQGKTQIFAPSGGVDFMRTRVTHSIEVAQIGRAIAKRFKIPTSLVEAACLGHDLGHPPFGHTGEYALDDVMREHHQRYEGNAQSFRIVTYLEQKAKDYEGLDLSRATLLGLIKYPYREKAKQPKFIYEDDADREEEWLFDGTGHKLLTKAAPDDDPPRTIVCQIMDWSDDIAYSVHDLEDGIASGILQPATWLADESIAAMARGLETAGIRWKDGVPGEDQIRATIQPLYDALGRYGTSIPKDVIREFTRSYIDRFAVAGDVVGIGSGATLFDYRLDIPEEIRAENQILKTITFEFLIRDQRTTTLAFKGKEITTRLFHAFFDNTQRAAKRDQFLLFPADMRATLAGLEGDEEDTARAVCDYIASMTEGEAMALYRRLFEPDSGSPFALS